MRPPPPRDWVALQFLTLRVAPAVDAMPPDLSLGRGVACPPVSTLWVREESVQGCVWTPKVLMHNQNHGNFLNRKRKSNSPIT